MKQRVTLVSVSGIISSGKSSLLRRLESTRVLQDLLVDQYDVRFVQEPVEVWRQLGVLQQFYEDPSRYAAAFQMIAFCTHVDEVEGALAARPKAELPILLITDRSMADQALFWQLQVEAGHASADRMHQLAYKMVFDKWNRFVPKPSLIVFIRVDDMQVVMRRLQRREEAAVGPAGADSSSSSESDAGRNLLVSSIAEEFQEDVESVGGITVNYQQRLFDKHCEWFQTPVARPPCFGDAAADGIPCIHLDGSTPYHRSDGSLFAVAERIVAALRAIE